MGLGVTRKFFMVCGLLWVGLRRWVLARRLFLDFYGCGGCGVFDGFDRCSLVWINAVYLVLSGMFCFTIVFGVDCTV